MAVRTVKLFQVGRAAIVSQSTQPGDSDGSTGPVASCRPARIASRTAGMLAMKWRSVVLSLSDRRLAGESTSHWPACSISHWYSQARNQVNASPSAWPLAIARACSRNVRRVGANACVSCGKISVTASMRLPSCRSL